MTTQESQIAELHSKVTVLLTGVEKIRTDFAQAQSQSNDEIRPIKEAFAENLASAWTRLAQELTNVENWQALEKVVKDADKFLGNLHQVVLRPRRTKLAAQLSNWLAIWTKAKVSWDQFLEEATDEQLDDLSTVLETIETDMLENDLLQKTWAEWVEYQVSELKQKQRNYDNLKSWLEHFNRCLTQACDFDEFLLGLPEEFGEPDTIKTIQQKWLDNCLSELSEIKAKQADLGLQEKQVIYQANWENLQSLLATLKILLQGLADKELSLVDQVVNRWKRIDADEVQELIEKLEKIANFKGRVRETPELSLTDKSLTKPPLKAIEELIKNRPMLVDPTKSKTLDVYLENLRKVDERLTKWLEEFEQAIIVLQQEIIRWKRLPPEHELSKKLIELENDAGNLISLETVIEVHNEIVALSEKIRRFLEQELTNSERKILNVLLQLRSSGQDHFPVIELTEKLKTQNYLKELQTLSEKNFISLNITIR